MGRQNNAKDDLDSRSGDDDGWMDGWMDGGRMCLGGKHDANNVLSGGYDDKRTRKQAWEGGMQWTQP